MGTDKKPFNETKVGKLIKSVLPNKGVIGVLKDILDLDQDLTQEDKESAAQALIRAYEAEVSDRDSARRREVEVAKTDKSDWLFSLTGVVGLGSFAVVIWAILALEIPAENKHMFVHLIGIIEGVALSIFGFYFGTSMKDQKK